MVSWKIVCVLTKFRENSPGKSYVFLQNFEKALLKIFMCSSTFCLFWKIDVCSYTIFGSPRKFDVFL